MYRVRRLLGYLRSVVNYFRNLRAAKKPVMTALVCTEKNINIRLCANVSPNVGIQGDGRLCIYVAIGVGFRGRPDLLATAQLQTTSTSKLTDSIARVCLCYSRSFCFLVDALVLTDSTESIKSWKLCRSSFYLSLPRLSGRADRSIEHSCICVYTDCTHATYLSSNQNNAKESEYTTLHK